MTKWVGFLIWNEDDWGFRYINKNDEVFCRINENVNKISVRVLSFRPCNSLFDVLQTKLFESLSVMSCAGVNFYLRYWRRNRSKDLLLIITTINCQLSPHLKLERQLLTVSSSSPDPPNPSWKSRAETFTCNGIIYYQAHRHYLFSIHNQ